MCHRLRNIGATLLVTLSLAIGPSANSLAQEMTYRLPRSLPDLNAIDWQVSLPQFAIWFLEADGTPFCLYGTASADSLADWLSHMPTRTPGETVLSYWQRWITPVQRDATPEELALCNGLFARNAIKWVVAANRTHPTRPAHDRAALLAGSRVEVGRVNVGADCGALVAVLNSVQEYRAVVVAGADAAAVCERAE